MVGVAENFSKEQMERFVRVGPNNAGYTHLQTLNMARAITRLDAIYIPASAQTEGYAEGVLNTLPNLPSDVVVERLRARMDREEALRSGGVQQTVVIGRRALTGAHIDEQQLIHLKTLVEANRPEMDIRIMAGEGDVLPTPKNWPLRDTASSLMIVHSFDEQRIRYTDGNLLTAHLDDGGTIVEGLLAARLEGAAQFMAATALRGSAALEAIDVAIQQLPASS